MLILVREEDIPTQGWAEAEVPMRAETAWEDIQAIVIVEKDIAEKGIAQKKTSVPNSKS